mmetsp:Transcript_42505/g.74584  ORF Transcript_42505/g.74584 Transcript_42505/m.74584 type:complete len:905 (-) Transcript_42505:25-2739(-)
MDFVVAANSGTHIYRAVGLEKPALLRSLPPAQARNPHCITINAVRNCLAVLQHSGAAGIWDLSSPSFTTDGSLGPACELLPQSGPITRCYFSPKGSFVVTWEPLGTIHRVERPAGDSRGGAFTKAENLSAWSLVRRPEGPAEFLVEVVKDGTQRLGVNVDNGDGWNGLLIRRIDPGLIDTYNREADPTWVVFPGDRIVSVNGVQLEVGAQAMAEEIQRAPKLRLRIRRGAGGWVAAAVARFFAPNISPLRWPPLVWSSDEHFAFRGVSNEVQLLDGRLLRQLRRITIDNISQMSISPGPGLGAGEGPAALAAFCQPSTSASPAMVRVFTDFNKVSGKPAAKPVITKSFFSDATWATMRWDPSDGTDILVLVHSSELTEADMEGRTLHGQGGNGLYLLRVDQATEPIAALSSGSDGVILDVQWCPAVRSDARSLVMLQGPQPAVVSVFSYRRGGGAPHRVNIGQFGVRNCLRWDIHGRSFCLRTHSLRGAGVSSEADCLDLFDAAPEGPVARRAGAFVGGKRDKEQAIGPSIAAAEFSPDGRVLLTSIEAHVGAAELKFLNVADGSALYRLKFDEIYSVQWRPLNKAAFAPPDFEAPPPEAQAASMAIIDVELRDREAVRRKVKALQARIREIERLKGRASETLDATQREKLAGEVETYASLSRQEADLELLEQPDVHIFEIQTAWGTHTLECRVGESCRELARRFCRERKLDVHLAAMLADRMEQRLQQPAGVRPEIAGLVSGTRGAGGDSFNPKPRGLRHGPQPRVVDLGDKDAVRRRVRALQKKLREIEKLKSTPEASLDPLQREKLATEDEVRSSITSLERELDLLERLPKMVFDVETDSGVQQIAFREGDDCLELARAFCAEHDLDEDLMMPLAQHMEQKLRDQAILESREADSQAKEPG